MNKLHVTPDTCAGIRIYSSLYTFVERKPQYCIREPKQLGGMWNDILMSFKWPKG
jgi:hypothetical protein